MNTSPHSYGNTAVIGSQWGDEAKGKIVDELTPKYGVIARAAGGANAGHTIVVNGRKHVFHLLPSGCLHPDKELILGPGMVISLTTLVDEIMTLRKEMIDVVPRLFISHQAHVVMDYHKGIDAAMEQRRSKGNGGKIGTTGRGIGPAYMEKAGRTGIRMGDLSSDLSAVLEHKAGEVRDMYGVKIDVEEELRKLSESQAVIGSCITDTVLRLHAALDAGKKILIEGAQATQLDLDHGDYPYVTSSSTTLAGALHYLGIPPKSLGTTIGVAKAYATRVGEGPFPTELKNGTGDWLRERGNEFGSTTGRPRRTGWLDLVQLNRANRINGVDIGVFSKLDVLDGLDRVLVAVAYDKNGEPEYESFPGWSTSTAGIRRFEDLPAPAKDYMNKIETWTKTPIGYIGTGAGREDLIIRI